MVFEAKYPILGFEHVTRYDLEIIDENFATIKNADGAAPAFTLVNPYVLRNYSFDIPLSVKSLMDIKNDSNLLAYLILIVKNPFNSSLANFLAPIVFNVDNKTMSQVVLDENIYTDYLAADPLFNFVAAE